MSIEHRIDRWLTTTPQDTAHLGDCNCANCHGWHMENLDFPVAGCEYCDFEIAARVKLGEWCEVHGPSYMENKECNECKFLEGRGGKS
jgi:hypothetical protein